MIRLFVALRPPVGIRRLLLDAMGGIPGARWQNDEQLHLTLRFIGEVERPLAEDIAAALGGVHFPAPEIAVRGVGQFDRRGRPDAVWAGIYPHDALARLHRKIDHVLTRVGLEPERRAYLPHVTLARLNAGAGTTDRFLGVHADLSSPTFTPGHFLLYQSTLGHAGARYEVVARYPFDPPA